MYLWIIAILSLELIEHSMNELSKLSRCGRHLTDMQGSELTPTHLPEASWNRLTQVIFRLNLPDGQVNKIQSIKQLQTRVFRDAIKTRFCCNKINYVRRESCSLCFILVRTLKLWKLMRCLIVRTLLIAISISQSVADFLTLRRV